MKKIIVLVLPLIIPILMTSNAFAEDLPIPDWVKNNAGWWVEGNIEFEGFVQGVQFLIDNGILVSNTSKIPNDFPISLKENAARWYEEEISDVQFIEILKDWIEGVQSYDVVKDQNSNDEIRFSGFNGPLINCGAFSYEVAIDVSSQSSVPVIIEIIDPDGNVGGRDEFQSGSYERNRIIEMNWGTDGQYLIQVHYKGEIYQEDFSYNERSPENYQSWRMSCLRETYLQPLLDNIDYIEIPETPYPHLETNFYESINYVNKLLRESDSKYLTSIISEENIKKIITGEKEIQNMDELSNTWREIESVTSHLVNQNHLKLSEEAEEKLMQNPDMTVDEKIELVLEFRKYNEQRGSYFEKFGEKFNRFISSIYQQGIKNYELKGIVETRQIQENEEKLKLEKEKELIREKILSKDKIVQESINNDTKSCLENLCDFEFIKSLPPLKQINHGIDPVEVTCKPNFELIFKSSDNSPSCVNPKTAEKLVERGWGHF